MRAHLEDQLKAGKVKKAMIPNGDPRSTVWNFPEKGGIQRLHHSAESVEFLGVFVEVGREQGWCN